MKFTVEYFDDVNSGDWEASGLWKMLMQASFAGEFGLTGISKNRLG